MPSLYRTASALPLAVAAGCMAAGACGAFEANLPAPARSSAAAIAPVAHAAILPGSNGVDEFARADDGLFYVHARINGHRMRFLVDTGASVVVLTAADAAAVGASPSRGAFGQGLRTVNGRTAMAWTNLEEVRIGGRRVRGVRAAVVRQGLGVSLLGQNLLARLGPIRIEGDRLAIG